MSWEVWTMKSKMSFFDPTLLKKNISRFSPAWAILLVGMFLAFPLTLLETLANTTRDVRKEVAIDHINGCVTGGVIVAIFAALIFAALVFKYLHGTKAAYMMHAFPMTRTCLFVTNTVSGLLFYLVPALLTTLCCLGVLAARGVNGCDGMVWGMFLRWTLQYLFFYGLAVFTMHISGNSVIGVLSYAALNFILLLIPVLVLLLIGCYFYGFDYEIPMTMLRLAPVIGMIIEKENVLGLTAIYAAVGVALTVLAWVHYRSRHVERAGDAMVYSWARIAFRLVFTFCCTLGLGWFLAAFFSLFTDDRTIFLPYALLGCFLGWFGSSMMLERTVKVFKNKKIWLGFAAFAAVLVLVTAGLKYDLLGLQRRVPETASVETVEIWTDATGNSDSAAITVTSPAQIEQIRAVHSNAIEHRTGYDLGEGLFFNYSWNSVHIRYHLKDGTTVQRVYELTEDKDINAITALYADPVIAADWYDRTLPKTILSAMLYGMEDTVVEIGEDGVEYYGPDDGRNCINCSALRDAMIADAAAGRLPISSYYGLYWEDETGKTYYRLEMYSGRFSSSWDIYTIPDTATETLKLFEGSEGSANP